MPIFALMRLFTIRFRMLGAIAVVLLPFFSTIGVVIAYTGLYVVAFFLCAFIRVEQPGFSHKEATAREQVEFS